MALSKSIQNGYADASAALLAALLPLARIMIRSDLGAGELIEIAKQAYVSAAMDEVIPAGRRINVSRLAVVTGLTRKEIAAILKQRKTSALPLPRKRSIEQRAVRVLRAWRVDPMFQRHDGSPADLPRRGAPASFSELVKEHGGDVTPVSVLRELERMNAVVTTRTGKIRLRREVIHSPTHAMTQLLEFAAALRDFATSLQRRHDSRHPPLFSGFKDAKLSAASQVALFQRVFSKRAATLLDGVDQWMRHQGVRRRDEETKSSTGSRVGIGIYLVQEDEHDSSARRKP